MVSRTTYVIRNIGSFNNWKHILFANISKWKVVCCKYRFKFYLYWVGTTKTNVKLVTVCVLVEEVATCTCQYFGRNVKIKTGLLFIRIWLILA